VNTLTIITNNVPRLVVDAYDLAPVDRAGFDYLDWDAIDRGEDSREFFRYRGQLYDMGDLDGHTGGLPADSPLRAWDGYQSDSFFSGIVVRFARDGDTPDWDRVIVGRYYS
jgi:hypothetical protein